MVQMPLLTKVSVPPLVVVQTPVVVEANVTGRPELLVAVRVGVVPKFWVPGLLKVMVCGALGVACTELAEATLVPTALVAVTVKE